MRAARLLGRHATRRPNHHHPTHAVTAAATGLRHQSTTTYPIIATAPPRPVPCRAHWAYAVTSSGRRGGRGRGNARRSFFGIFQKAPRQLKRPEIEPGWETIMTWRVRVQDSLRPPRRAELLAAFRALFAYKARFSIATNSTQALHCRELLAYLVDDAAGEGGPGLQLADLLSARDVLLLVPAEKPEEHLMLSKALYREITRLRDEGSVIGDAGPAPETPAAPISESSDPMANDFRLYLKALTQYGAAVEASSELQRYWQQQVEKKGVHDGAKKLWIIALDGLAREGRETELLELLKAAEAAGVLLTPKVQEILVRFFAARDRVPETRQWFEKKLDGSSLPSAESYRQIMRFALRNKQDAWSTSIFEALTNANPSKSRWDVIFQWAVLAMGKGVEDVKHMILVMGRHADEKAATQNAPNIDTINGLIEVAIERDDSYMAERFVGMGTELGIQPDARTYLLQIDYRVKARDLSGAAASYQLLQGTEIQGDEDLPVLNRYIRALAAQNSPDFQRIESIIADLEERVVTLEPQTVAALALVFLENDRRYDVIDVLSTNIYQFSVEERALVRDTFINYCLDRDVSTARVWSAYQLLKQFFTETPVADRVRLMEGFFARRRPDMATLVFGHMRQADALCDRPTLDVYVRCFELLGRHPDADSLRLVHNMLKMDVVIQPDTRLYNSLMYAYAAAGEARDGTEASKALDYWKHITNSAEGPSYRSLEIVFWVCERRAYGDREARGIWAALHKMDIDIPPSVAVAYAGALAGNGDVDSVTTFLGGMVEELGYGPDDKALGVAYNAIPSQSKQDEFKTWAKREYPAQWAELEKVKSKMNSEGLHRFLIEREIMA